MRARLAAAACALSLAVGCGGIVDPSKNQTSTFSGTLAPQEIKLHAFSVSKTGEFTAKVTALTPSSSAVVGLALLVGGNDGSCSTGNQTFQQNNFVNVNLPALGGQIFSGKYCAAIYDVGALTTAQTYTLTVSHP